MSAIIEKNIPLMVVICNNCTHHIKGIKCKAFAIIPDEIIFGKNDHSKPLADQGNELVYQQIGGKK